MLYSRQSQQSRNPGYKPVALDKTGYGYVKTLELVGLGVSAGYQLQSLETEGCKLTPTPTVVDGTPKSVFWDFHKIPTQDSVYSSNIVSDYFSPLYFKPGDSFVVSNSSYSNDERNFNGTYTFISFKNGMLVSTTALSLTPGKYSSEKFDSIPVFQATVPGIKTFNKNEFLITNNVIGSNSFLSNGVKYNCILEIADVKFRVISIEEKANKEYVLITATDRTDTLSLPVVSINNRTLINLYKQDADKISSSSVQQSTDLSSGSSSSY